MGSRFARGAEERLEAVVAAEHDEALGLLSVPALEDLLHGTAQVVVADHAGHAADPLEADRVALEEGRLVRGQGGRVPDLL